MLIRLGILSLLAVIGALVAVWAPGSHADTPPAFQQVTAGEWHACGLTTGGAVECWGDNRFGQLGHDPGSMSNSSLPIVVPGLGADVTQVSAGGRNNCALMGDTTVRCWGDNGRGAIGNGTQGGVVFAPAEVGGLSGVTQISVGDNDACALLSNTQVWCWGDNVYGQLGDDVSGIDWLGPVPTCDTGTGFFCEGGSILNGVAEISTGGVNTCAVMSADHSLKCWGSNYEGQLGIGTAPADPSNATPDCDTQTSDTCRSLPVDVDLGGEGVASVSASETTCVTMEADHSLQCWGYNAFGAVGNGENLPYPWSEPNPQAVVGLGADVDVISSGQPCAVTFVGAALCGDLRRIGLSRSLPRSGFRNPLTPVPGNLSAFLTDP